MWKFELCNDWSIIWSDSYKNRWTRLLEISPTAHVFFHPMLVKSWIDTYLPIRRLSPIFIWGNDTSSGNEVFIPFVLWKRNWRNMFLREIIPVGYSDYDYHNPIFRHIPCDISLFWNSLFNLLKTFSVDCIIVDGITNRYIESGRNWAQQEPCPYLELSELKSEDDLMSFFKTSLRGDIRRQIRRMCELGNLNIHEYSSFEEVKDTFSIFMKEHSMRWPKAYKAPNFHKNMLEEGMPITHFSSLNIGERPIAWHLGFEYKGVYYYYMPIGDHEYAKFSPTKVHLFYLIKRAIDRKLIKFDHLRGEETYKSGFSNRVDFVNSINIQNESLISRFKLSSNKLIRSIIS